MQELTQCNAHFGCNWCLHPGKWVANPLKPNCGSHKYPLCAEPVAKRNMEDSIRHMESGTPQKPCMGFKTASPLIN